MTRIRPFTEPDIPAVIEMTKRLFPDSPHRSDDVLRSNLEEGFLTNPWYDPSIPSFVCETDNGKIAGFLGVTVRNMIFHDERVRVATSQHMMVSLDYRTGMSAFELLKAFLEGPQDLSMADMANDISRVMWERLGGSTARIHSFHWRRILRPVRFASILLGKRARATVPVGMLLFPVSRLLDWIVVHAKRSPLKVSKTELPEEPLDAETLISALRCFTSQMALRPEYDSKSLAWLLQFLSRQTDRGTFHAVLIRDDRNAILGWYIYFLNPYGSSEVLQVGGREETIDTVVGHLSYHALSRGAADLTGRIEPRFMKSFSSKNFIVSPGRMWMLVHSRNRGLLDAILRGDTFLSRLEGDLWIV